MINSHEPLGTSEREAVMRVNNNGRSSKVRPSARSHRKSVHT
jgi:hypothetical protein